MAVVYMYFLIDEMLIHEKGTNEFFYLLLYYHLTL